MKVWVNTSASVREWEQVSDWVSKGVKEWVSKSVSKMEQVNDWVSEWVKDWVNKSE